MKQCYGAAKKFINVFEQVTDQQQSVLPNSVYIDVEYPFRRAAQEAI